MKQTQITPELYEQIKQQILAEQKATQKTRAQEREKARREEWEQARKVFDPLRRKYTPLLAQKYANVFMNGRSLGEVIDRKINEAIHIATRSLRFYGCNVELEIYRTNKADEANQLAGDILDAIINNK